MRKIVKTGAAALMLTCMAGNVWAAAATAAGCAKPADMSALQTAAKQQKLMVAALSCNAAPLYNVYSQLVYSLKASDVGDVMVNGKIIVRSRKMLTIDDKAVLAKAQEYRAKVAKSLSGN